MRKYDLYVAKLLRDRPTHTQGGIRVTYEEDGRGVKTWSDRWKKGGKPYAYYLPMDYPTLFGWNRNDPEFQLQPVIGEPMATKVQVGDYVYVEHHHKNGTIVGDRGGHVGRWTIKLDDGGFLDGHGIIHASSRDLTVIKAAYPKEVTMSAPTIIIEAELTEDREPTLEERVALIEEHLGITIERVPSKLVVVTEEDRIAREEAEKAEKEK